MIAKFTITAVCSFNCDVELKEKISKRELMRRINSGEIRPHILSENTYDFKGYTARYIEFEEGSYGELDD